MLRPLRQCHKTSSPVAPVITFPVTPASEHKVNSKQPYAIFRFSKQILIRIIVNKTANFLGFVSTSVTGTGTPVADTGPLNYPAISYFKNTVRSVYFFAAFHAFHPVHSTRPFT
jgi:hypothetical protein